MIHPANGSLARSSITSDTVIYGSVRKERLIDRKGIVCSVLLNETVPYDLRKLREKNIFGRDRNKGR